MDDMTFCLNGWKECGITRCERHPKNIQCKDIPHSFAEFYKTDLCPLAKEPELEAYIPSSSDTNKIQVLDEDVLDVSHDKNWIITKVLYNKYLPVNYLVITMQRIGEEKDGELQ